MFISLLICLSYLTPDKIYYNRDRLESMFKVKYMKVSEIRSIEEEVRLRYRDLEAYRGTGTFVACSVLLEDGRYALVKGDCDSVMNSINGK